MKRFTTVVSAAARAMVASVRRVRKPIVSIAVEFRMLKGAGGERGWYGGQGGINFSLRSLQGLTLLV